MTKLGVHLWQNWTFH